jgi:hypothetical protein
MMLNHPKRGIGKARTQRIIEHCFSNPAEALMRAAIVALVAVFGLMALPASGWTAPAAPHDIGVAAPAISLVRDGCGAGWHRQGWRDRWGNWRSRCVPNRW